MSATPDKTESQPPDPGPHSPTNKPDGPRRIGGRNFKWWALASVATGTLVTVADMGEVNVAMPTIADEFGSNLSTVQWLATGHLVATSALLMPMGRLSDMIGRKRVYLWGLMIFTLGSLLAAFAPNLTALIMFRILQGMGVGLVHGNQMAIMTSIFPAEERGKALGMHMTLVGSALIIGPAIGGMMIDAFGWRSVFLLNLPLGILCTLAPFLILDESAITQTRVKARLGDFDFIGSFLSSAVLVLMVMGLANPFGLPFQTAALLLVACALTLGVFILWETRATTPMLDLTLFKISIFSLGVSARCLSFVVAAPVLFLMPFFLQGVQGYSAGQVGLIMMSIAVGMVIMGPVAGRLSDRFGPRPFTVGGALISMAGLLILSQIDRDTPIAPHHARHPPSEQRHGNLHRPQRQQHPQRRSPPRLRRRLRLRPAHPHRLHRHRHRHSHPTHNRRHDLRRPRRDFGRIRRRRQRRSRQRLQNRPPTRIPWHGRPSTDSGRPLPNPRTPPPGWSAATDRSSGRGT